jgi:hypothetical protein
VLVGGRRVLRSWWHLTGVLAGAVFAVLLTVGAAIALVADGADGVVLLVGLLALTSCVAVAWYWWVTRVVLDDDGLELRSALRIRRIGWDEVHRVEVKGGRWYTMPMGGYVPRLTLLDGTTTDLWQLADGWHRGLDRRVEEIDTYRRTFGRPATP